MKRLYLKRSYLKVASILIIFLISGLIIALGFIKLKGCPLLPKQPPVITNIVPNRLLKSGDSLTMKINGEFFSKNADIRIDSYYVELGTLKYINSQNLEVDIHIRPDAPGTDVSLIVINPDGKTSSPWLFSIVPFTKNDMVGSARSLLYEDEIRDRPKIEYDKRRITLDELKRAIEKVLSKYGFEFRQPIFDDENRLQTYIKDFKGRILQKNNYYERVVIIVRISENIDNYRVFMVAYGQYRRRIKDIDQEEPIPQSELDKFVDRIVILLPNIKEYGMKQWQIWLVWQGTRVDINLRVKDPRGDYCLGHNQEYPFNSHYRFKTIRFERVFYEEIYTIEVNRLKGNVPTEANLIITWDSLGEKYALEKYALERSSRYGVLKGDDFLQYNFNFRNHSLFKFHFDNVDNVPVQPDNVHSRLSVHLDYP